MKLYFAYGSNMWIEQMKARCPEHRKIGTALLSGYRWMITTRGYASVVEAKEDEVEGVLFELSESDERSMDNYEGVADGFYHKFELPVLCNGKSQLALVYIDPITEEGPPKEEYIGRINAGLADACLSNEYVLRQVRKFIPARVQEAVLK
ncbi:MAG: gamma-glutamylcyclotransferase family protein [Luteolibacter sp.]|uniref:gamma-glutamylcyclotransferase family protein n=1 Tax=Luteolibacter sp. TaxID=1962973 RepID=UPI00326445AF